MGPAPITITESPRLDLAAGDAVQGDGHGLGEGGGAATEAGREAEQLTGVGQDVVGEAPVEGRAVLHGPPAVLALRRLALTAAPALPASGGRAADDLVARSPTGDPGTDRRDHAGPLVALDPARGAPALEDHVDVRAADPAVAHLDEHLARLGRRDRALLDHDLARSGVDRTRHRGGNLAHALSLESVSGPPAPRAPGTGSPAHLTAASA